MTCAAATFPGVTAFDCRVFAFADFRRAISRGFVVGLGAVTAAGLMGVAVTLSAACIIAVCFSNPTFKARTPGGLASASLIKPYSALAGAANFSGLAGISSETADAAGSDSNAEPMTVASLPAAPSSTPLLSPPLASEPATDVPLPSPRPLVRQQVQAQHDIAAPPAKPVLTQVADASLPSAASFSLFQKDSLSQQAPHIAAKPALPQVAAIPPPPDSAALLLQKRVAPPPARTRRS